jgi:hypothetical protein
LKGSDLILETMIIHSGLSSNGCIDHADQGGGNKNEGNASFVG